MVECTPSKRVIRVRFPDSAITIYPSYVFVLRDIAQWLERHPHELEARSSTLRILNYVNPKDLRTISSVGRTPVL